MKNTTVEEDRAADKIQDMANHLVEAIHRLDTQLEEREDEIKDLTRKIDDLKEKIRELERNQA